VDRGRVHALQKASHKQRTLGMPNDVKPTCQTGIVLNDLREHLICFVRLMSKLSIALAIADLNVMRTHG
jgi:hypothetical protein